MNKEQMIFWRGFLLRTLVISVAIAVLLFIFIYLFWHTWTTMAGMYLFVLEHDLAQATLQMFMMMRIVIVFFMLAPAIALHWMIKKQP